jgi:uncharacterized RmlC-like cupin family protein
MLQYRSGSRASTARWRPLTACTGSSEFDGAGDCFDHPTAAAAHDRNGDNAIVPLQVPVPQPLGSTVTTGSRPKSTSSAFSLTSRAASDRGATVGCDSRDAAARELGSRTMTERVSAVRPGGLRAAAATPGVLREVALETSRATLMRARAEPRAASGWHHHGERDVFGYVVRGAARFEFGPDGTDRTEVDAGGFFHVPARLIHRDVNPLDAPQEIILTIVGEGPLVFNVDGPAASTDRVDHAPN